MDELSLKRLMEQRGIDLRGAETNHEKSLQFLRALNLVIPPKDVSDRVTFRRIQRWLHDGCQQEHFDEHTIYRRVIDFALEASGPKSRNPAAVFMSIIKKELNYKPESTKNV